MIIVSCVLVLLAVCGLSRLRVRTQIIIVVAFVLAVWSALAFGQEPKIAWVELGADAGVRALDVYSTHRALSWDNHEAWLPKEIAHRPAVMSVYSGGMVALDWLAMRKMERRHPKAARWIPVIDGSQDGFWAVRNLTLKPK